MRRPITTTVLLAVSSLLFAGCGQETSNPQPADAGTETFDSTIPEDTGTTIDTAGIDVVGKVDVVNQGNDCGATKDASDPAVASCCNGTPCNGYCAFVGGSPDPVCYCGGFVGGCPSGFGCCSLEDCEPTCPRHGP